MSGRDAVEKKIQAICEELRLENFKVALKQCNQTLKKFQKHQYVRALKAIALDKLHNFQEALEICDSIKDEGCSDPDVIYHVAELYRTRNSVFKIQELYEKAMSLKPRDPDILAGAARCFFGQDDYLKAQNVMQKMYKILGGNGPLFAYITCVYLQAWQQYNYETLYSEDADCNIVTDFEGKKVVKMSSKQLLQLAHSLIKRMYGVDKPMPQEVLRLYLDICIAQGKFSDAMEVLSTTPLQSLEGDELVLKGALYLLTDDQLNCIDSFKEASEQFPDNWCMIQLVMNALLPETAPGLSDKEDLRCIPHIECGLGDIVAILSKKDQWVRGITRDEVKIVDSLQEIQEHIDKLISLVDIVIPSEEIEGNGNNEQIKSKRGRRGPDLAKLEVERRKLELIEQGRITGDNYNKQKIQQQLMELIWQYHYKWGWLPCCAKDVRCYCTQLSEDIQAQLAGKLKKFILQNEGCSDKNEMMGVLAAAETYSLLRSEQALTIPTAIIEDIKLLFTVYKDTQKFEVGLEQWDTGLGDELLNIILHFFVVLAKTVSSGGIGADIQGDGGILIMLMTLVLCTAATHDRPKGMMQIQMLSSLLFGVLGCPLSCLAHLSELEMKSILYESLGGHLIVPMLLALDGKSLTMSQVTNCLSVQAASARDSPQMANAALERGTYSMVVDIIGFKQHLLRSHNLSVCRGAEVQVLLSTMYKAALEEVDSTLYRFCERTPLSDVSLNRLWTMTWTEDWGQRPACFPPPSCLYTHYPLHWHLMHTTEARSIYPWWKRFPNDPQFVNQNKKTQTQLIYCLRAQWLVPHMLNQVLLCPEAETENLGLLDEFRSLQFVDEEELASITAGRKDLVAKLLVTYGVQLFQVGYTMRDIWDLIQGDHKDDIEELQALKFNLQGVTKAALVTLERCMAGILTSIHDSQKIIPGDVMCGIANLIRREGSWTALCTKAWCHRLSQKRKKKTKKPSLIENSNENTDANVDDLEQLLQFTKFQIGEFIRGFCKRMEAVRKILVGALAVTKVESLEWSFEQVGKAGEILKFNYLEYLDQLWGVDEKQTFQIMDTFVEDQRNAVQSMLMDVEAIISTLEKEVTLLN